MRGSKPAGFSSTEVTSVTSTPRRLDLCSCRWWDARQKPISLIAKAARSARGQIRGSSFQTANNGPTGTRQVQPTHDNPLIYSIRVTSHLCQRQLRQITDICFTHICSVDTNWRVSPPASWHPLRGIVVVASWHAPSGSPQASHPRPLGIVSTASPISLGRSRPPRALPAQSLSPPSRWSRRMSSRKVRGLC